MNNKGYTILELVVALALLSIIIVFMMALLVNLKMKEDKNGVDTKALLVEASLVKTINSDIEKRNVSDFSLLSTENEGEKIIKINFTDGSYKILKVKHNNKIIYGTDDEIDIEKTLPSGYYVDDVYVENNDYKLCKLVIKVENINNKKRILI